VLQNYCASGWRLLFVVRNDPSPVALRLMKAPERDTLSPGERAADSLGVRIIC
jgi:hypothetical protein